MNLNNLFKIGAVWNGLFGVMMLFAGSTVMEGFGFTPTDDLLMMSTYMGVSMLAMGVIHWFIPIYAVDNLKKYGMVVAPIWGAFAALDVYHYAIGNQPVIAQNVVMTLIMTVIAVMFFIKSKD